VNRENQEVLRWVNKNHSKYLGQQWPDRKLPWRTSGNHNARIEGALAPIRLGKVIGWLSILETIAIMSAREEQEIVDLANSG
jgi:hypothetical protein